MSWEAEAESQSKRAVLTPCQHWSSTYENKGYKAYQVTVDGVDYGRVLQEDEHVYKKVGRLRYGDRKVRRWVYRSASSFSSQLYYTTRKRAVYELICDRLRKA